MLAKHAIGRVGRGGRVCHLESIVHALAPASNLLGRSIVCLTTCHEIAAGCANPAYQRTSPTRQIGSSADRHPYGVHSRGPRRAPVAIGRSIARRAGPMARHRRDPSRGGSPVPGGHRSRARGQRASGSGGPAAWVVPRRPVLWPHAPLVRGAVATWIDMACKVSFQVGARRWGAWFGRATSPEYSIGSLSARLSQIARDAVRKVVPPVESGVVLRLSPAHIGDDLDGLGHVRVGGVGEE